MNTDYLMVPVPQQAISAVYALLAEITKGNSQEPSGNPLVKELAADVPETEDDALVPVEGNGWWSPDDIVELAIMLKNPAGRAILTLIAKNSLAGELTSYGELREAGQAVRQDEFGNDHVRAQLSWVSKYCKTIKGEHVWPLVVQDNGPDAERGSRYQYFMPESLSEVWLNTAGE